MKKLWLIAFFAAFIGATVTLGAATAYAGNHCQGGNNDSQGGDNNDQ